MAPIAYLIGDHLSAEQFSEIKPIYFESDAAELIKLGSAADIASKREQLISFLWGQDDLPTGLPTSVEEDLEDDDLGNIQNLKTISRLTIDMEWGLQSIAYHFLPIEGNGQLFIYHQGHDGGFLLGQGKIEQFLEQGYAVMAFSMPLLGQNSQPIVKLERFGVMKLTMHEQIALLPLERGHPVKFFIEPVVVALNYASTFNYDAIHMTGISGGAWTTTLCAALDTRVVNSYPVAGTRPFYLRAEPSTIGTWSDYESTVPDLYNIANYLELYVLGAYGNGRHQLQIINQFDPCCFEGIAYQTYEEAVKARLNDLGSGQFDVFLDSTHMLHNISQTAMEVILDDVKHQD